MFAAEIDWILLALGNSILEKGISFVGSNSTLLFISTVVASPALSILKFQSFIGDFFLLI